MIEVIFDRSCFCKFCSYCVWCILNSLCECPRFDYTLKLGLGWLLFNNHICKVMLKAFDYSWAYIISNNRALATNIVSLLLLVLNFWKTDIIKISWWRWINWCLFLLILRQNLALQPLVYGIEIMRFFWAALDWILLLFAFCNFSKL